MGGKLKISKNELDLKSLKQVLTVGISAAGLTVASFFGTNSKIVGGWALLKGGLLLALNEDG